MPLLVGTIVITLLMIFGVTLMFSGDQNATAGSDTVLEESVLVNGSENVKGATESAQVTVVEFSDFQCPACKSAQPLVTQLMAEYGENVRFIYRHYPLVSIHPNAQAAAVFAEAAADQGKFWEVHDLLFEKQSEWSGSTNGAELLQTFLSYAQALELDTAKLEERMNEPSILEVIQRDVSDGNTAGISGTPTFYVNGVQTSAPQLLSAVETIVTGSSESTE